MQRSLQKLLTALDHHMGRLINRSALFSNVFVVQNKTPFAFKGNISWSARAVPKRCPLVSLG